jgi:hypothetical protein
MTAFAIHLLHRWISCWFWLTSWVCCDISLPQLHSHSLFGRCRLPNWAELFFFWRLVVFVLMTLESPNLQLDQFRVLICLTWWAVYPFRRRPSSQSTGDSLLFQLSLRLRQLDFCCLGSCANQSSGVVRNSWWVFIISTTVHRAIADSVSQALFSVFAFCSC